MVRAGARQSRFTGGEDGKFAHHPSRLPRENVDQAADSAEYVTYGVMKVPGPFDRAYLSANL